MKEKILRKHSNGSIIVDSSGLDSCIENIFVGKLTADKIYGLWNCLAKEYNMVPCSFLSDSLRRKITKNLNTFPPDTWKTCFCMIQKSTWLHDKGWFNLSWLMHPENFVKVLDGAYNRSMKTTLPTNAVGDTNSVHRMMKKWKEKK